MGSIRRIDLLVGSAVLGRAVTWSYPDDDGNLYEIPTYQLTVSGTLDNGLSRSKTFEVFRFGVQRKDASSPTRVVGLADQQTHVIKSWLPNYPVHSASSPEKGAWQVYDSFLIHDGPDDPLDIAQPYASIGCIEICNGPMGFVSFNDFILSLGGSTQPSRGKQLAEIGASKSMIITYTKAARPGLKLFV